MIRRIPRFGLPIGGLQLVLLGGAAYLVWEHEQGKHSQPHMLCPVCWLNRIAPADEPETSTTTAAQE